MSDARRASFSGRLSTSTVAAAVLRLVASLLLLRYYGSRTYGRILGAHFMVLIPGRVIGPVLAGAFHDRGYGYGSAFWLFALLTVIMVLPMLRLHSPSSIPGSS